MSRNKDEYSNSVAVRKMFCETTETLTVRELRDPSHLILIPELLAGRRCKIVNFFESEEPDMVLNFLTLLNTTPNVVNELHIDIWNTDFDKFMVLLKQAVQAHSQSLDYLALKCRLSTDYLTMIFDFLPKRLKMLDLSENTICNTSCLKPLVKFIETSELERLRIINCNLKNELLDEFVKLLLEIDKPFPLASIQGIDISTCLEVPINVRKYSKEAPKSTRRRQLRYLDRCKSTRQGCCIQFIDYMRNAIFMKRLVGSRVRVWWPATKDDIKTAFAGRFWPATVMMVNPADMVFVVKYDNDDIEHVPCKYVQPLSPYKYGGGLVENYLDSLLGANTGFNILNRFMSLDGASSKRCIDSAESNLYGANEHENSGFKRRMSKQSKHSFESESVEFRTPDSTCYNSVDSTYSRTTCFSGNSKSTIYDTDVYNKNNSLNEFINANSNINSSIETVERNLGIDGKFDGNLLSPGEFCELRDPLDQFRNDPSDYVGVVKSVSDQEPLYECICIYQDNEDIVKVSSNDIRRLVLIPWYNWVNLAFKILIYYGRQMSECVSKTPSRYQEHSMSKINRTNEMKNKNKNTKNNNNNKKENNKNNPDNTRNNKNNDNDNKQETNTKTNEETQCKLETNSSASEHSDSRNSSTGGKLKSTYGTNTNSSKHDYNFSFKIHPFSYVTESFHYLEPMDLGDLSDYCPKNPLEMRLTTIKSFMEFMPKNLNNHTRLKLNTNTFNSHYNDELKIKSLMEYNEILQKELQIERNKNIELQSKLNCILCFDTQINCMLDPCAHFSFCYECATNLKNCPICRHKINKLKILRLN